MEHNRFKNSFAENIFKLKYAQGPSDSWDALSERLIEDVCGTRWGTDRNLMSESDKQQLCDYIKTQKFIPGGRYLYYAGRPYKAFNNCYLLRCENDTREEWSAVTQRSMACLMTGGGIGVDYSRLRASGKPLSRTGGISSGPIPLMYAINEIGRNVRQGGSRRSAIYASLHHSHEDAPSFLKTKNWGDQQIGKAVKADGTPYTFADAKHEDFNFNAPLDMTNISINWDEDAGELVKNQLFIENCKQAMSTGEPGFSFNFGAKKNETLRNAPVAGSTRVLTNVGYKTVKDIIGKPITVWTGKQWAITTFKLTNTNVETVEVFLSNGRSIVCDPSHPFIEWTKKGIKRTAATSLKSGSAIYTSLPYNTRVQNTLVLDIKPTGIRENVYCCDVKVDEHSFVAEGVVISNCTEVTSEDDSDVCNLGSINMGNIKDLEEFKNIANLASKFLVCGTLRADLPYEKVYKVREKNRRLGLGLMGIHEWLLKRGMKYEVTTELHKWLAVYRDESERAAKEHCDRLFISHPVAFRAIAPTGTIGILAATTTGVEPLFAVAYKRRFLTDGTKWKYQYVVDGVADRLIREYGLSPDKIETSNNLARDYERRIKFQADVQDYVDMSISSTINLPTWGSEGNSEDDLPRFSATLAKYASRLRGFTAYPDGARGGQPITEVSYNDVLKHKDMIFDEIDVCELNGKGGGCGV